MKGLQIKANWSDAASQIQYKLGRADSWHYSPFQVADARHSKSQARALVKRWLMNEGYSNPGGRKLTKKQRRAKTARTAKKRAKSLAVSRFMKKMNPAKAKKGFGYRVKRLRSGGFSITPVKLEKGKR